MKAKIMEGDKRSWGRTTAAEREPGSEGRECGEELGVESPGKARVVIIIFFY